MSKQPKTKSNLTESQIRHQLGEVATALAHLEAEREILLGLRDGLQRLLRLRTQDHPIKQHDAGAPSARSSVLRVLVEAQGQPLHAKEILIRMQVMGAALGRAQSSTEDRVRWVDLLAYSLIKDHNVHKVGPRTWRWNGDTVRKQVLEQSCE